MITCGKDMLSTSGNQGWRRKTARENEAMFYRTMIVDLGMCKIIRTNGTIINPWLISFHHYIGYSSVIAPLVPLIAFSFETQWILSFFRKRTWTNMEQAKSKKSHKYHHLI